MELCVSVLKYLNFSTFSKDLLLYIMILSCILMIRNECTKVYEVLSVLTSRPISLLASLFFFMVFMFLPNELPT